MDKERKVKQKYELPTKAVRQNLSIWTCNRKNKMELQTKLIEN